MGHRANYVIVDGGERELHGSRFGATTIPVDLLAGRNEFD